MSKSFDGLMSELNSTTVEKLVATTAIIPVEDAPGGEVYVARIEMDNGQVRGVINYDSMESALEKAADQVMDDLEEMKEEDSWEEEESSWDEGDEEGDEEDKDMCKDVLNKAVEHILKTLSKKKETALSVRHIESLKSAMDEVGFDKLVDVLEKINNK